MVSALKVSQISSYIGNLIIRDSLLSDVAIQGEISNLSSSGGILYFNLKDEKASLSCIIFRSEAYKFADQLKDGKKIIAKGSISIYEKSSKYQLIVRDLEEIGLGKIYEDFIKLKNKLDSLGLFKKEHKKTISKYPSKIGLITSENGAALYDVLNVFNRRYPFMDIYFYPTTVQGIDAVNQIITALDLLDNMGLDLILITRGGGSFEDLFEFNNEKLAYKVYESQTPIVSAIGHEVDTTIVELVSDLRGATPTEAAEKITPNHIEMIEDLSNEKYKLDKLLFNTLNAFSVSLDYLYKELNYKKPINKIITEEKILENIRERLRQLIEIKFNNYESSLEIQKAKIDRHNSSKILSKGYALLKKDDSYVSNIDNIYKDDSLEIIMHDGQLEVDVIGKVKNGD